MLMVSPNENQYKLPNSIDVKNIFNYLVYLTLIDHNQKSHFKNWKDKKTKQQHLYFLFFFFSLGKGGRGLGKLRTISRSNLMIYSIVDFGKLLVKKRKVLLKATWIHLHGVGAYSLTRVWSKKGVQGGSVNSWVQFPLWSCGSIFRGAIRERGSERQRKR